jgi:hypothetical protein
MGVKRGLYRTAKVQWNRSTSAILPAFYLADLSN